MATAQVVMRRRGTATLWSIGRWSALAAVLLLLVLLLVAPAGALQVLWYVAIPILPAVFFLNSAIWRGICPLATLNQLGNHLGTQRSPSPRVFLGLSVGGLVLFHLMVPARHFLFNQHGPVLAGTVTAVAAIAVLLGALFTVRSAFCNALCPVLPVELLYGQAPLLRMDRGRCDSCTICTPKGCLDLAGSKALPQLLGSTRHSVRWLATPHGVFFTALPGFIIGYNRVADGSLGSAAGVYLTTLGWSLASFLLIATVVWGFRLSSRLALTGVAALAGMLYYWYAGPSIMRQFDSVTWLAAGIRAAGIGLVLVWLVQALRVSRAGA
jgi:hypothetical protein